MVCNWGKCAGEQWENTQTFIRASDRKKRIQKRERFVVRKRGVRSARQPHKIITKEIEVWVGIRAHEWEGGWRGKGGRGKEVKRLKNRSLTRRIQCSTWEEVLHLSNYCVIYIHRQKARRSYGQHKKQRGCLCRSLTDIALQKWHKVAERARFQTQTREADNKATVCSFFLLCVFFFFLMSLAKGAFRCTPHNII